MSIIALKIIGLIIIVAILAFAWRLWVNATTLENEIEAESDHTGEE